MRGLSAADADLVMLRAQLIDIILGTVFLSIGATACAIAAIRRRGSVRTLLMVGNLERALWPANPGPPAHCFAGSAPRSQICRALR